MATPELKRRTERKIVKRRNGVDEKVRAAVVRNGDLVDGMFDQTHPIWQQNDSYPNTNNCKNDCPRDRSQQRAFCSAHIETSQSTGPATTVPKISVTWRAAARPTLTARPLIKARPEPWVDHS